MSSPSIQRRLMRMMLLSSVAVMAVMTVGFCGYEYLAFRQSTVDELRTLSGAIASNSTAALAFDNTEDAVAVLAAFKSNPHVVLAALYDAEGKPFATYPVQLLAQTLPQPPAEGYRFAADALIGVTPVMQGGAHLGSLYVRSDLEALYARARLYALLLTVVSACSLALAYLIARRLQGQLLRPIAALADTARAVFEQHDYSVRAAATGSQEFDLFADTFNQMLGEIQRSEAALTDQLTRLDLLQQITRAIGDRQDLDSIFRVVLNALEDNRAMEFGCLMLRDSGTCNLTVRTVGAASLGTATTLQLAEQTALPPGDEDLARCLQGEVVCPDKMTHPFASRLAQGGLRSLVLTPLKVENEVFGVLACARHCERAFSAAECEFLRQLSGHVALASHQARLYGALQQAYDDLRQSQHAVMQQERLRALGQMASGIAHDINNAISPVYLYTESLLERETTLSERARGYLQTIQRAIGDVAQTVARMREFYREREAQLRLDRVDLNHALRQVVELTKPRWGDQPQQRGVMVDLQLQLTEPLPAIMGAEHEIRDALTNLIFNAVDAMPGGGPLVLRTRTLPSERGDERAVLEVCDSGVGMDEDTRRRCLEPFYTTKGERGTGLGLAMVYGMIQRHSAEIEIESTVGIGTIVRLSFPVATSGILSSGRDTGPIVIDRRLRILLVDDDPLLIKSLQDTLQEDGHVIEATHGGQAGIDAFSAALRREEAFDIVITDLGMPRVDGRRVAAEIKTLSPTTPVILLTGWGQRMIEDNERPAHVSRVLSKPPRLQDLRTALAELAA